MHIVNLRSFDQTVMVDTWICSLSMAGTMMILLAATNITSLASCLGGSRSVVGPHLVSLLQNWAEIHGEELSPSVQQAMEWIRIVDDMFQHS